MKKILITILIISFLSGCALFEDKRVRVEPKYDITAPRYKKMLKALLDNRYDSEYLRWIAADSALEEYKLSLE